MSKFVAKTKSARLFSFAVAGGSGFVIDVTVLYLLLAFTPLGPFVARLFSVICAMISNFIINRTFTFGQSDRNLWQEFLRYASVGSIGVALNYAIYAALLLIFPGFSPFLATLIAVVIVAFFSYFGYSKFVFTK